MAVRKTIELLQRLHRPRADCKDQLMLCHTTMYPFHVFRWGLRWLIVLLLVLLVFPNPLAPRSAAAACTIPVSFAPKTDYPTGLNPSAVGVGDLNYDGWPDLVVANRSSHTISVYLASGAAGAFGAKTDYPLAGAPTFVALGDLNGDGFLDLAVPNGNSQVSVLLADGSPAGFAAATQYPTGSDPFQVVIQDVNGDGTPDLITANQTSNTVSVLLANGSPGSFAPKLDYPTGSNPRSVAVGDLDGDGRPDLAVANVFSNSVSVLLGSGSPGNFAPKIDYPLTSSPIWVQMADLNGDGRRDLAAAAHGKVVSVLLGSGSPGSLAPAVDFLVTDIPFSLAAGDFNRDGRLDLVTTNPNRATVSVLLASGDPGSFAAPLDVPTGASPVQVTAADVDGDGWADLAVANDGANTASVLRNQPALPSLAIGAPTDATTSSPFSVTVRAQDACGGTVSSFSSTVTLHIKSGTGAGGASLGGQLSVPAVSGVATFDGLRIDKRETGYVLRALAGAASGDSEPFRVANAVPIAHDDALQVFEDTPLALTPGILANDTDADGDTLTPVFGPQPVHGAVAAGYTPSANFNGVDSLTYRAFDGMASSNLATVQIQVLPVNDPPDFTAGPDQIVPSTAGAQHVEGWASQFTPGPADESTQALAGYTVVSTTNPSLFAVAPAVDLSGRLTYTPQLGQFGVATIGVVARDTGGTAHGGTDTSAVCSFTITVTQHYQIALPLLKR